jgi:pimeloyl-ACP methyl ester carboxylesterase
MLGRGRRSWGVRLASTALAAFTGSGAVGSSAQATTDRAVVHRAMSFSVVNVDRSSRPCASDGRQYTLHGFLVAPSDALENNDATATLFIHGSVMSAEHLYAMRPGGDASYDFSLAMARAGHIGVYVDLLGWGTSTNDIDGDAVCTGSEADMIHQIVDELKAGQYQFDDGTRAPAFSRVALAGMSLAGQMIEPAQSRFGNADALVVMGYADLITPTAETTIGIAQYSTECLLGRNKYADNSGPPNYCFYPPDAIVAAAFYDADQAVLDEVRRVEEGDPRGVESTGRDDPFYDSITVPVLLAFGDHDEFYPSPDPESQFLLHTGSADRTLFMFPGAGHAFFLERQHARWIGMISGWLTAHGF